VLPRIIFVQIEYLLENASGSNPLLRFRLTMRAVHLISCHQPEQTRLRIVELSFHSSNSMVWLVHGSRLAGLVSWWVLEESSDCGLRQVQSLHPIYHSYLSTQLSSVGASCRCGNLSALQVGARMEKEMKKPQCLFDLMYKSSRLVSLLVVVRRG
jgi:hypothetical protein